MEKMIWEVSYYNSPPVVRYCKKCGKKEEFINSGNFRVNAQGKYLDIWLIYKCSKCSATWNVTLYSRVNPKSLTPELLDKFHNNNMELANECGMNIELMKRNGAETLLPSYEIRGEVFPLHMPTELHILSPYPSCIKVSTVIRKKMGISTKDFEDRIRNGWIRSSSGQDLKKMKLQKNTILLFEE